MGHDVALMPKLRSTQTVIAETRGLLAQTRYRIAACRRLLNPSWRIGGASDRRAPRRAKESALLHIERWNGHGADPLAAEYIITYGSSNGGSGTVLLSKQSGLLALREFLEGIGLAPEKVTAACQVLAEAPRHRIADVRLTQAARHRLRL